MKNIYFLFSLIALIFIWSCDQESSSHPCDDPYISNTYLRHNSDSLFPYNKNWETLKYLYSNDTIKNDTMIFNLERVEYWDVDTTSAERCFIHNREVRRFFYKATAPVFKKIVIMRNNDSHFEWEDRNKYESFNYESDNSSEFNVQTGVFYNSSRSFGTIKPSYVINSYVYSNVYYGYEFRCETPKSRLAYSTKYGFLEIRDSCDSEVFTILK